MNIAKATLVAAALFSAAPIQASAAFVDHQAIRACFARAQFLLTENSGDMIASNKALVAVRAAKGWRVSGTVYNEDVTADGAFSLDCLANEEGVTIHLSEVTTDNRLDR